LYALISKSLYFLLNPLSWIFAFLILALFKKKCRKKWVAAALALLFIYGNPALYRLIIQWWEPPVIAYHEIPKARTAYVLGGALKREDHVGQFNFNASADRLIVPFSLWQEGRVQNLVVSAARIEEPNKPNHLELYKNRLGQLGVDTQFVFVETQALNTYQNALYAKEFLNRHQLLSQEPFLLVTSALHMRRAAACFKRQGLHFVPIAVDTRTSKGWPTKLSDYLLPGSQTLYNWNALNKEIVGLLAYKILGYA
jgi:uncharacterized SAM-binding protein YcdF (DUF218 family)